MELHPDFANLRFLKQYMDGHPGISNEDMWEMLNNEGGMHYVDEPLAIDAPAPGTIVEVDPEAEVD